MGRMQLFSYMGVRSVMKRPFLVLWLFLVGSIFLTAGILLRPYFFHLQPSLVVPTPAMPRHSAFDVYEAASRQMVYEATSRQMQGQAQLSSLDRLSPAQEADLVQKNVATLKTLRLGLPLPYQPPPARSINDKFPYYQQQRSLARLLAAEGRVRAAHGDWSGAAQSDLDSIQLGTQIVQGSPLIGCLVGLACEAIGRRALWTTVPHLNAAEARTASQRLLALQANQVPFAETLQEEKWFGVASMQEQLRLPPLQKYPQFLKSIPLSNYAQYMDQLIANARQPYAAHPAEPVPTHDPISVMYLPVFNHVYLQETDSRTQNAFLCVALALHAYRLEHGVYPATLEELVPSYLPSIPADPFALSGSLRYQRTKSSDILYSVGPDGKDDSGRPILHAPTSVGSSAERSRHLVLETSKGDIVAGINP
jgi:hypothetical protein